MSYTPEDAENEVGDSTDWEVGRRASIKKWLQTIQDMETQMARDYPAIDTAKLSYGIFKQCGFCFVVDNNTALAEAGCGGCPASKICRALQEVKGLDDAKRVLQDLEELDLEGK